VELLTLSAKECLAAAKAAKHFLRHAAQLSKRIRIWLRGVLPATVIKYSITEGNRRTHARRWPFHLFENQVVFRQELSRFEGLTYEWYTIGEAHRLLNFARNNAHSGLTTRPGGIDILAPGIFANPVCVG